MALPDEPLTRGEQYLAKTSGQDVTLPDEPLTRMEQYLAKIAGQDVATPDAPLTRMEQYLAYIAEKGGGGGDITLETLTVSSNGTTNAPSGTAYNKVVASVPNTYSAGDEGKVVSNGALVAQTAHAQVTQNGTIDTTQNNSVEVAVPVPTLESKSIGANGTYTPASGKAWNEVIVNTPAISVSTGTITLQDTDVDTLTIPVDTSGFTHVYALVTCTRTGIVSGGVVTYDDVVTPDAGSNSLVFGGYVGTESMFPSMEYKYQSDVSAETYKIANARYMYTQSGRRLNEAGFSINNSNIVNSNGISYTTGNASRRWCRTGVYMEFNYTVYGW